MPLIKRKNAFKNFIQARYLKVYPTTSRGKSFACMRLAVLGCDKGMHNFFNQYYPNDSFYSLYTFGDAISSQEDIQYCGGTSNVTPVGITSAVLMISPTILNTLHIYSSIHGIFLSTYCFLPTVLNTLHNTGDIPKSTNDTPLEY